MRMKKLLAAMLAALMLCIPLAACSSDEPVNSTPVSTAPVSSEPAPEPAYEAAYLTGLEKTSDYPENRRITGVMLNNIFQCRPQDGTSSADILMEAVTEGGITRYMGLFTDYETIPHLGPVRSARDQFFQILLPTEGFYIHIGESVFQSTYRNQYNYDALDMNGDTLPVAAWEDRPGYDQEHRAYTSGQQISAVVESQGYDDKKTYDDTFFKFVRYDEEPRTPADGTADSTTVTFSDTYISQFDYDSASKLYNMSKSASDLGASDMQPFVDQGNNEQVAFTNLVVIFAPIQMYENSYVPQYNYDGGGVGYVFTNGGYEKIKWEKPTHTDMLKLISADGSETLLNPGKTYLGVSNVDYRADFEASLTKAGGSNTADSSAPAANAEP